jgi:hypothetical protein
METSTTDKDLMEILLALSEDQREALLDMHRCGDLKVFLNFSIEKPKVFEYLVLKAIETQDYDQFRSYIRKQ